ncbi:MAG: sodium:solute symporter [Bacteroidetes bacterium]|nr:sodium:solute symporter [Bacteroidota bacterium]
MVVKIIVIALYALMIIIVGIIGMRKTKSFKDFLMGGGNVGPWMTAFSYGTAYFSAVVFIGFAGKVGWGFGLSGMWIALFNGMIGVLGVWAVLGWKIKKISIEMKISTLSEFLENRYKSPFLKLIASIAIFVFLIPYSSAVFIGLSKLFEYSFTGIEYWHVVVFIAVFTIIYLVLGGYKSMAIIDTIFGFIMIIGVGIMIFFTLREGNGYSNIVADLKSINPKLTQAIGPPGWWPLLSLVFLTSVAPFAMPQLIQKFYAIKDKRSVRIGMIGSTLFALLIGFVAYFIGSTTRVFLKNPPLRVDGTLDFDAFMPVLLNDVIPENFMVIILILLLSASMSTLASLILVSSSSMVKDFYNGFINKNVSDKNLTTLMRVGSAVFVIISAGIAINPPDTIVAILGISWGALGATFLGSFIWGLFSKKVNKTGAIASMIGGLSVVLVLAIGIPGVVEKMASPQAGTIGMLASLAICPIFSFFGKPQE